MKVDGFKVEVIPTTYYKSTSLEKAIERLFCGSRPGIQGGRKHFDPV